MSTGTPSDGRDPSGPAPVPVPVGTAAPAHASVRLFSLSKWFKSDRRAEQAWESKTKDELIVQIKKQVAQFKKLESSFMGNNFLVWSHTVALAHCFVACVLEIKSFTARIAGEKETLEKLVSDILSSCGVSSIREVPATIATLKQAQGEAESAIVETQRMPPVRTVT
jgi:hypothetical protein